MSRKRTVKPAQAPAEQPEAAPTEDSAPEAELAPAAEVIESAQVADPEPEAEAEVETMDEEERAAWEEYQRRLVENRARKAALVAAELAAAAGLPQRTELALADSWYVDTGATPPVLLLEESGVPAASLPLASETLEALLIQLNALYILPDDAPISYQVRIPDVANAKPILSLIRGGAVLGSMVLDEDFNANVGSILRSMYREKPAEPALARAKAWVKRHKVYTALLVLLALPVAVVLAQGIYNSVLGSFS